MGLFQHPVFEALLLPNRDVCYNEQLTSLYYIGIYFYYRGGKLGDINFTSNFLALFGSFFDKDNRYFEEKDILEICSTRCSFGSG